MDTYHKINTVFKRTENGKIMQGIYSIPELEYLKLNDWYFTEKVDGINIRIIINGESEVDIRGRTDKADLNKNWVAALEIEANKISEKVNDLFEEAINKKVPICFYGESYGSNILRGKKYREDCGFVLFDIKIGNTWQPRNVLEDAAKYIGLDVVPIISAGTLIDGISLVRTGFNSTWGDFIAEGVVAKPMVELNTRQGKRIITKIKHKDFKDGG